VLFGRNIVDKILENECPSESLHRQTVRHKGGLKKEHQLKCGQLAEPVQQLWLLAKHFGKAGLP